MKHFSGLFATLVVAGIILFLTPEPVDARCKQCRTTACKPIPGRCVLGDDGTRCLKLTCPRQPGEQRERRCIAIGFCDSWGASTQNGGTVTTPGVLVASQEASLDHAATSSFRTASVACTPPPVTRVACVLENGTLSGACRPDPTDKRQTGVTGLLARQATAR